MSVYRDDTHAACEVLISLTDEVDPYTKPPELLEVSPKGLVPGLRFNNTSPPRALNESTVILEYLEEYVAMRRCTIYVDYAYNTRSLALETTKRSLLPPSSDPCACDAFYNATYCFNLSCS